jgi:4-amino-4-deoxy-L-arabinose transferase-like glycosyltransferase
VRKHILLLLCLCTFATLPWLGSVEFYTRGEPREALVAQAMLNTGDWVLPTVYSGSVPSKPPFSHWLMALASLPHGSVTEFSARLPAALAFIFFIVAFYAFLARKFNEATALRAALILFTASEWFRASVTCRVDAILAVCMAGGLMALFAWSQRQCRGLPWLAIFLLAGAALVKGPVGIVLPSAIFTVYLWLERFSIRRILEADFDAFVPPLIIAGSWYVFAFLKGGDTFLNKVYYENFARFAGSMQDHPHSHSAFYLFATLLLGFLPWTVPILASALIHGRDWLSNIISAFQRKDLQTNAASSFLRFCIICMVCFFVFYSIPSSKRSVYLLPCYPFGAALIASFIGTELRREHRAFVQVAAVSAIFFGSVVTLALFALGVITRFDIQFGSARTVQAFGLGMRIWQNVIVNDSAVFIALFIALLMCVLALIVALSQRASQQFMLRISFALFVLICLQANATLLPGASKALSLKPFSTQIMGAVESAPKLYSFGDEFYGVSFYLNKPLRSTKGKRLADGALVLCYQSKFDELSKALNQGLGAEAVMISETEVVKPGEKLGLYRIKNQESSLGQVEQVEQIEQVESN